jgi:hypothetical protein
MMSKKVKIYWWAWAVAKAQALAHSVELIFFFRREIK